MARSRFALVSYFHMVAHKPACITLSSALLEIYEEMEHILLMLIILYYTFYTGI